MALAGEGLRSLPPRSPCRKSVLLLARPPPRACEPCVSLYPYGAALAVAVVLASAGHAASSSRQLGPLACNCSPKTAGSASAAGHYYYGPRRGCTAGKLGPVRSNVNAPDEMILASISSSPCYSRLVTGSVSTLFLLQVHGPHEGSSSVSVGLIPRQMPALRRICSPATRHGASPLTSPSWPSRCGGRGKEVSGGLTCYSL